MSINWETAAGAGDEPAPRRPEEMTMETKWVVAFAGRGGYVEVLSPSDWIERRDGWDIPSCRFCAGSEEQVRTFAREAQRPGLDVDLPWGLVQEF